MRNVLRNMHAFTNVIQGLSCKPLLFTVHGRLSSDGNVSPISGRGEGRLVIAQCVMGFSVLGNQRM